jgi:uncharacterized Zn-binding protein involved in type VI secretion
VKGAARVLDPTVHGGLLNTGAPGVLVNGRPAVRVGDHHGCMQHGPGPVVAGAPMVWIGGRSMARVGDLLMCIGAGSGTDEKSSEASASGELGPFKGKAKGKVDKDKLTAEGEGEIEGYKKEGTAAGGKIRYELGAGEAEGKGLVGPGGYQAKGEASGARGKVEYGDDDNHRGIEGKVGSVEAERDVWVGEQDGKYGFSFKDKKGADTVTVKGYEKRSGQSGDYGYEATGSAEVSALGADTDPPVGVWAYVDPESGEICIGGYGQIEVLPGVDVEINLDGKARWKPPKPGGAGGGGGSGAIPNFTAAGSFDVLLG